MQRTILALLVAVVASAATPDGAHWESKHGLVFVCSAASGTWIGQELVTNTQFQAFSTDHRGDAFAAARGIPGDTVLAHADWLRTFEVAQGTLEPGAHFRLPQPHELPADAANEWLHEQPAGASAEAESRAFRIVLVTGNEARAVAQQPSVLAFLALGYWRWQ